MAGPPLNFRELLSTKIGFVPPFVRGDLDALSDRLIAIDESLNRLTNFIRTVSPTDVRTGSGGSQSQSTSTSTGSGGDEGWSVRNPDDVLNPNKDNLSLTGSTSISFVFSDTGGLATPSEVKQVDEAIKNLIRQRNTTDAAFTATNGGVSFDTASGAAVNGGGISGLDQLMLEIQTATVLGYFDDGTLTLAGRQFDFLMESWFAEQIGIITLPDGREVPSLDRVQIMANLTGYMLGADNELVKTLSHQQYDELLRAAKASEAFQEAGLSGYLNGERTVAGITLDEAIRSNSARETLTALGQLESARANRAGEGLTREGNQIAAIGQQLAARARLGDLTLADAEQRRRSIDTAFTQRRAELVQAAPFAVNPDDVFESESGQQLVELPLAGSIGSLLTLAGVPDVEEDFGTVPVFNTNPDAVGQGVLDASAFDSPVPGYAAALDTADAQFANLFSRPVHGEDATSNTLLNLLGG
jgi:hypothetical protein